MVLTWTSRAMVVRHCSNLLSLCDQPLTFLRKTFASNYALFGQLFEVVCFYFGIVFLLLLASCRILLPSDAVAVNILDRTLYFCRMPYSGSFFLDSCKFNLVFRRKETAL